MDIPHLKASNWFCTGSTDWPALGGGTAGCQGRPCDHTSIADLHSIYDMYMTYV